MAVDQVPALTLSRRAARLRPRLTRVAIAAAAAATLLASVRSAAGGVVLAPGPDHLAALAASLAPPPPRIAPLELSAPEPRTGYVRGRREAIEVVRVGEHALELGTARAFAEMHAAAAADGVALQISSGFRSNEEQAELYRAWRRREGNPAARPGRSNHQSGRAIDLVVLNDPAARAWLEDNAARFGFKRTVSREPWHWEYAEAPRAAAPAKAKRGKAKRGKARALAKQQRAKAKRKATAAARRAASAAR